MKRIFLNITLASIITLVAYIALYAVWGAILSGLENSTLRMLIIALMTTVAFGFSCCIHQKSEKILARMRLFQITKIERTFLLQKILG